VVVVVGLVAGGGEGDEVGSGVLLGGRGKRVRSKDCWTQSYQSRFCGVVHQRGG
jgi:hypothetical protein